MSNVEIISSGALIRGNTVPYVYLQEPFCFINRHSWHPVVANYRFMSFIKLGERHLTSTCHVQHLV